MGLINQLSMFVGNIADHAAPLRDLMKVSNIFTWLDVHQTAMDNLKKTIASPRVLAHFSADPSHTVALHVDASRLRGLGFVLLQRQDAGVWRLIHCGSRFLSPAESRYLVTEMELLGAVWAANKMRIYLIGRP